MVQYLTISKYSNTMLLVTDHFDILTHPYMEVS
jgi:hypothetical protein